MKKYLLLIPMLAATLASLPAAADPEFDAVRRADDARVIATVGFDREQLAAILSDDLTYGHSTGKVDNKASFIDAISSGRVKYASIIYESRKFTAAGPGIVLMTGRCVVNNAKPNDHRLSFLAVWREENGVWRFLAWQSGKLPATKS